MRRIVAPLSLVLALAACVDPRVSLSYRLDAARRLEYRLVLDAEIDRSLSGQTRHQSVVATYRATQEVMEVLPAGGARTEMALTPEALVVDGRSVPAGPPQVFLVTLGADGRVVDVERAGGEPEEALQAVGLERLLPRLRPVLPGEPVSPGDQWSAETEFTDQAGRFSLALQSRLASLGTSDGQRAALVRTTYRSPVSRREVFANAVADVRGRDVGVQETWFALEGYLLRAQGDSVGRYRVTFRPPGGETGLQPVEGTLGVRLHTEMRLAS